MSLVIGHWSFVVCHWSFVIGHLSFGQYLSSLLNLPSFSSFRTSFRCANISAGEVKFWVRF
ncbi:MAG: hypothetical protein F6K31_10870 [Symploca sp. SIO2G7]|nr:hypothetical protein [Symploca sp. SIO2G7]